jgi:hypothetical protein
MGINRHRVVRQANFSIVRLLVLCKPRAGGDAIGHRNGNFRYCVKQRGDASFRRFFQHVDMAIARRDVG